MARCQTSRPCGFAAPRRDEHSWEGGALPDPPVGGGMGARASGPHPQGDRSVLLGGLCPPKPSHRVRGWGNPVAPHPCARAAPAPPRPPGGIWGNPVAPHPCARAAPAQTLPRARVWGNPVSPFPCVRARPSGGQGRGGTWFPHVHVRTRSRTMREASV